ncbi:MAG: GCN5-related N-acetyltransferase [Caulobacteraceae bacterium]|nr:GCN5-related N-acetyltransferase [Caulobacter sp.]
MGERLPAAARARPDWPIRLDHCFGRVILDAVYGRPWREAIAAPAWRNMDPRALQRAIELAEDIAEGRRDLAELNAASLRMRAAARSRRAAAR